MPKRKKSLIKPKLKPKLKSRFNLKILLLSFLAATLLVGGYFYSIMEKAEINMISESKLETLNRRDEQNNTLKTTTKSIKPTTCTSVVRTIAFSGSCETDGFSAVSYSCGTKSKTYRQGSSSSCKTVSMWFDYVKSHCQSLCPEAVETPPPSPWPTPSASSIPTSSPVPSPLPSSF